MALYWCLYLILVFLKEPAIFCNEALTSSLQQEQSTTLFVWGRNYRRHADEKYDKVIVSTPENISSLGALAKKSILKIDAHGTHFLAICSDSNVYAWGNGEKGKLGNGIFYDSTPYGPNAPVQVQGLKKIVAVACGTTHSLALASDGRVYAWGSGHEGQLGNSSQQNSAVPIVVQGLSNIQAIAAGNQHSLALASDGRVYAWGSGHEGQLGNSSQQNSAVPIVVQGLSNIQAIAAGNQHSLALASDGRVYAWGDGQWGQLGNGEEYSNSETRGSKTPVRVLGLTGIKAIEGGGIHSLALDSIGRVYAWGFEANGRLGDGKNSIDFLPNKSFIPVKVHGLIGIKEIKAGDAHSMALGTDGRVYIWGKGNQGQLGNDKIYNIAPYGSPLPLQVPGLYRVQAIAAGSGVSLAITIH